MSYKTSMYFVAWVSEDNAGKPNMPYKAAQKEYLYRIFRNDYGSRSAVPITEAMTYDEAIEKKRLILLLTQGS